MSPVNIDGEDRSVPELKLTFLVKVKEASSYMMAVSTQDIVLNMENARWATEILLARYAVDKMNYKESGQVFKVEE